MNTVEGRNRLRRLRCWIRGKLAQITKGQVWHGHCWGDDGRCVDCGSE